MNTKIAIRDKAVKPKRKQICVYLKPCNEKQELNYFENFVGTPKQVVSRSIEIIQGLQEVLRNGDFSVKIENSDSTQTLYLDSENLFDNDFNVIGTVEDFYIFDNDALS